MTTYSPSPGSSLHRYKVRRRTPNNPHQPIRPICLCDKPILYVSENGYQAYCANCYCGIPLNDYCLTDDERVALRERDQRVRDST